MGLRMNFTDGIEQALLSRNLPIISYYTFFLLGYEVFSKGEWNGERLKRMPKAWDEGRVRNALNNMEKRRALVPDEDFKSNIWRVTQSTRAGTAEEVACIADPFCYVSHLSAMQKYSLTERSPKALHLTTPARPIWNEMRDEKILADSTSFGRVRPPFHLPGFREVLRRRPVVLHVTSHPWKPVKVSGEETRMTSPGQTFADMVTRPELCGGMRHVMDVWTKEAEYWIDEIVDAVDQLDSKIGKVRAGYLLSEFLGIDVPALERWEQFTQRGGSRKLDPEGEYAPVYSERWMISLNV